MSNKRTEVEWGHRRQLKHAGWDVNQRDAVAFNHGSETLAHAMCKMLVSWHLRSRGYRIDTEVEHPDGEVDVLAYGVEDRDIFVVECETNPTEYTIEDKLDRYVRGQPVKECFVLNVDEMPERRSDALAWVRKQL